MHFGWLQVRRYGVPEKGAEGFHNGLRSPLIFPLFNVIMPRGHEDGCSLAHASSYASLR